MAEKTIKLLQFWYLEEYQPPGAEEGDTVLIERIASRGDVVDITQDSDLQRGEEQDAFMTDDEVEAFKEEQAGVYRTEPYQEAALQLTAEGVVPAGGFDWETASADDMADHMEEANMTVNQVLEVAHAHPNKINELLQAEDIVTGDSPRKGVVDGLAKIANDTTE